MQAQPGGEGIGRGILQQIDRVMLFHVDQERAVDPPTTDRKLIDAEHARRVDGGFGQAAKQAQERHAAGRHRQLLAQPRTRPPTQGQPDDLPGSLERQAAAGVACGQGGHLLRKGAPWTLGVVIAEAADPQVQDHLATAHSLVGNTAGVVAVDAAGPSMASRTRGSGGSSAYFDVDDLLHNQDPLRPEVPEMRKQNRNAQRNASRRSGALRGASAGEVYRKPARLRGNWA
jgi:hypothetical protein